MKPPRRRFSERMGLVPVVVQTDGMTTELRNSIWNVVSTLLRGKTYDSNQIYRTVVMIASDVLRVPRESVVQPGLLWLQVHMAGAKWPVVYDVLDYVVLEASSEPGRFSVKDAITMANEVLEREHSGFRFVAGELTRVMHPVEASGVEDAMVKAKAVGLHGAHEHITQALALFGKRPDPDYRNAIKEAISAVESAVKIIEGVRGGGLQEALDALAKKAEIHKALRDGLVKLYGFTSDASGIRHPLMEAPTVGEEDARFMIVTCSAAVNWIIAKADKAGLLNRTP